MNSNYNSRYAGYDEFAAELALHNDEFHHSSMDEIQQDHTTSEESLDNYFDFHYQQQQQHQQQPSYPFSSRSISTSSSFLSSSNRLENLILPQSPLPGLRMTPKAVDLPALSLSPSAIPSSISTRRELAVHPSFFGMNSATSTSSSSNVLEAGRHFASVNSSHQQQQQLQHQQQQQQLQQQQQQQQQLQQAQFDLYDVDGGMLRIGRRTSDEARSIASHPGTLFNLMIQE